MRSKTEAPNSIIRQRKRYGWLIALLCAATLAAGIGGVYAWEVRSVEQANTLDSHSVAIKSVENYEPVIKYGQDATKEVEFTNTGSAPVFLRVAVTETWKVESGLSRGEWLPNRADLAAPNWLPAWKSDWVEIDGWYYYKRVLPGRDPQSGDPHSTGLVLDAIRFAPAALFADNKPYDDASYSISFLSEAVQLSDEAAFADGSDLNSRVTLTVFGMKATVVSPTVENGTVIAGDVTWERG